jgi:excisionase family DNA binding protein
MAALAIKLDDVHEPSSEDIEAARTAARQLSTFNKGKPVSFTMAPSSEGEGEAKPDPISLPANIFRVLINMLVEMGNGNAVAVVPVTAELTTQQAADILNVSRPHLVKLLEAEKIPFRMVGTHRKLRAQDVLCYRDKTSFEQRAALSQMVNFDEEFGLDDEPIAAKDD